MQMLSVFHNTAVSQTSLVDYYFILCQSKIFSHLLSPPLQFQKDLQDHIALSQDSENYCRVKFWGHFCKNYHYSQVISFKYPSFMRLS